MLADILQNRLTELGFTRISSNITEVSLYYREIDYQLKAIQIINLSGRYRIGREGYESLQQNAKSVLASLSNDWELLNVVVASKLDNAKVVVTESPYWILDEMGGRLYIYENQPIDYYGLKGVIEEILSDYPSIKRKKIIKGLPLCTIGIIAVNFIIFFILFIGNPQLDTLYMLKHGAMYLDAITYLKEYYRLFTSMFLHFDIWHILNNMVVLYLIGSRLEKAVGPLQYVFIYLVSGLGGNLLSLYHDIVSGTQSAAVSAGASGAVFGVMGALLVVVIKHKGKLDDLTSRRLFLMLACSLYYGFIGTGIDNYAHVGGAITGMISTFILYWPRLKKHQELGT